MILFYFFFVFVLEYSIKRTTEIMNGKLKGCLITASDKFFLFFRIKNKENTSLTKNKIVFYFLFLRTKK